MKITNKLVTLTKNGLGQDNPPNNADPKYGFFFRSFVSKYRFRTTS